MVGFKGALAFDASKPDGTPRKLLDASLLSELGWKSNIDFHSGLASTYSWYLENIAAES